MAGFSKWIGGGLGWAFAGPIGAILGFAIGSMFDNAGKEEYRRIYQNPDGGSRTQSGDFSASLLILAAAVMKAASETFPAYELDNFFYVTAPDKAPYYSVDASSDDEDLTLTIDPDGKILEKEQR